MATENTPPPETPSSEGITEQELEGIITRVFDARMEPINAKLDGMTSPDLEALRTGLLEDVSRIVTENKSSGVDEGSLLTKIGDIVDAKMKGQTPTTSTSTGRRGGPLSRWLTGSS